MTSAQFDSYVIDTILNYAMDYGVCEVDFDSAKIQHQVRDDYIKHINATDEEKLKHSLETFNAVYSHWDDVISAEIKEKGKASLNSKNIKITDVALSERANQFLARFIVAILQAKFDKKLALHQSS